MKEKTNESWHENTKSKEYVYTQKENVNNNTGNAKKGKPSRTPTTIKKRNKETNTEQIEPKGMSHVNKDTCLNLF